MNESQRVALRALLPLPTLDLALAIMRRLKPAMLARMLACGLPLACALWAGPELVRGGSSPTNAAAASVLLLCLALALRAWLAGGLLRALVATLLPVPDAPERRAEVAALGVTVRSFSALAAFGGLAAVSLSYGVWALPGLLALWLAGAAAWPAPLARAACRDLALPDSHLAPVLAASAWRDGVGRRGSLALVELSLLLFTLLVALNLGGLALVLGGVLGLAPLSDAPTLLPFPLRVFRDDPAWAFALLPLAVLCVEPLRVMVMALVCVRRLTLDGGEALAALDAVVGRAAGRPSPPLGPGDERAWPRFGMPTAVSVVLSVAALWLFLMRLAHAWRASSATALGLQGEPLSAFMEGAPRSWPVVAAVCLYVVALFFVASLRTPPLSTPRAPAQSSPLSFAPELELRARMYRMTGLPAAACELSEARGPHALRRSRLRLRKRVTRRRPPPRHGLSRRGHGPRSVRPSRPAPIVPTGPASIRVAPSLAAMGTLSVALPVSALMPVLLLPLVALLLAVLAAERTRLRQLATLVTLHGPRAFVVGQPGVLEARLRGPLNERLSRLSLQVEFAGGRRGPWLLCVPSAANRSAAAITVVVRGRRDASLVGVHVRGELRSGFLRAHLSFPCTREVQVLRPAPRLPAFPRRHLSRSHPAVPGRRLILALDTAPLEDAPADDSSLLGAALGLVESVLGAGGAVGFVAASEGVKVVCPARPGQWGRATLERELRGVTVGRERSDLGALLQWADRHLHATDTLVVLTAPFAQREALGIAARGRAPRGPHVMLCGSFADELEGKCQASDACERQAALDMLAERREVRRAWLRRGIEWVDVPRHQLAVSLLRRYLDRRPRSGRGRRR